jgi:hypothetical protein
MCALWSRNIFMKSIQACKIRSWIMCAVFQRAYSACGVANFRAEAIMDMNVVIFNNRLRKKYTLPVFILISEVYFWVVCGLLILQNKTCCIKLIVSFDVIVFLVSSHFFGYFMRYSCI